MSVSWKQKKLYEYVHGKIPKGFHIHRIIPGYLGGKYTLDNMIALSPEDHVKIHEKRWEEFHDHRDLLAAKLLKEKRGITLLERCSLGGKVSGNFQNKRRLFRDKWKKVHPGCPLTGAR